ncbi:MAG: quinone-dependent dihydroorotate dehydrogenase [Neisseriaceae bacterium]|nr:quinone-dependent dihydroorotate dehydrogenase [Neisseriaceae bacterium]MBP6862931.1 quinone-dependent dihydroorotate dehydrogenase [Neisseriaceae bacterium]
MYDFLRSTLFKMDAEKAHHLTLNALKQVNALGLGGLLQKNTPSLPTQLMGLTLPNPVGLAAGLDKNGAYVDALAKLGFGFIEVGTITPRPQEGNPKPRLFRVPEHQAIINRMGFNNAGVDVLINNLKNTQYKGILGINIGKNATTPMENAVDDYLICLEKTYQYADYITINISSPNTKNLRALQAEDDLTELLSKLKDKQLQLQTQQGRYVPLAVKIAPDLSETEVHSIADVLLKTEIDGVIATNTTIDKSTLGNHPLANEQGGLSGLPVRQKSNDVLHILNNSLQKRLPIIGVGGIVNGVDAAQKMALGADAVQIYSGLIYQGPKLVLDCLTAIARRV